MSYLEFKKTLEIYPIFSLNDIEKIYPSFDRRRLVEWQKKGYLLKIRRGYYCFTDSKREEHFLNLAANKIYSPSYISMESGLSYYNLIPEGVFMKTSITTRNTASFETSIGNFDYKHVKTTLFFGYKLMEENGLIIKMAEPEKVILDYFYINKLNSIEDIKALRLNEIRVKELINFKKLSQYRHVFNSRVLSKRIRLFENVINA